MKPKTVKIAYWISTIIFSLMMLMDGYGGVARVEDGQVVMKHLQYPVYLLSIVGTAKILGAVAILQPKFQTIKEWAYAGFAINFVGAAASRAFMGDSAGEIIVPLVALGIMFIPYFFLKKYQALSTAKPQI